MYQNEKGITLTELLATIVIAFFAMGIVYSVLMLAINYFNTETTKTRLQQEANYIITELQRVHRKGECYTLIIEEEQVAVKEGCTEEDNVRVISSGFGYETTMRKIDENKNSDESTIPLEISPFGEEINPNEEDVRLESFIIKDLENEKVNVTISTAISRYHNSTESEEEVIEE